MYFFFWLWFQIDLGFGLSMSIVYLGSMAAYFAARWDKMRKIGYAEIIQAMSAYKRKHRYAGSSVGWI